MLSLYAFHYPSAAAFFMAYFSNLFGSCQAETVWSKKLHLSRFHRFQQVPKHHFEHNTVAPGRYHDGYERWSEPKPKKNFFFPIISGFQKKNQEEVQIDTKNVSHGWKMDANFWWM